MRCPRCRVDLVSVTSNGAVSWRCGTCKGVAVGVGVLRRFAPKDRVAELWNDAWRAVDATGDGCPSCRSRMRTLTLELDGASLELDACRACLLVWFDADELRRFSPQAQEPPAAPKQADALSPEARRELGRAIAVDIRDKFDAERRAEQCRQARREGPVGSLLDALFG